MSTLRCVVNQGKPLLAKQWQLLRSAASTRVVLGGYGSGKTTAAVLALVAHAVRAPWTPAYGENAPTSIVFGITDKVIRDSSLKVFRQVVPRELVRRERKSAGERSITLVNGHEIIFRTWGGRVEGVTACGGMLDEAHLLEDSAAFTNFLGRLRDPLQPRKLFLVSGIPEFGWLRELWGPDAPPFPDSLVVTCSAYENRYLLPADLARIQASCSSRSARTYMRGEWAVPETAIYYEWDPATHVVVDDGDPNAPCHLSMDVGERGAVLWWQERTRVLRDGTTALGLHVVDEWTPEQLSARSVMREVCRRRWRFQRDRSLVFVDPATDRDEIESIYDECSKARGPVVEVVRKLRGDAEYAREEGFRAVNAALRDANGDVRLTVSSALARGGRGLLASVPKIRRHETSGRPVKDNLTDHIAMDAFRYPVAHLLPLKSGSVARLG